MQYARARHLRVTGSSLVIQDPPPTTPPTGARLQRAIRSAAGRPATAVVLLAVLMAGCEMEKPPTPTAADIPDKPEAPPNTTTPLGDPINPDPPPPGPTPDDRTPDLPDPAVRTHCVNVENLRAPFLASFDWRRWEWDFVNSCGESVRVTWFDRNPTIEWGGWATSLDVGERNRQEGLWAQNSNPPNPITVWCAWVGTSSDPCYRENSYLTNPTNWREMHY